jgi:hypothetical protein
MTRLAHPRHLLAGAALVAVVMFGGTACGHNSDTTINIDASWAVMYHSMGELKAHSDLGVLGSFTKVVSQTQDAKGIPYTDFAFTVQTVLHNPGKRTVTAGSVLRIHQTGGTVDNAVHQIADDPLFNVGETAALFLVEYQPGYFRVAGGPTGRFEVNAGKIAPVNDEGIAFSGSTDDFKAEVQRS